MASPIGSLIPLDEPDFVESWIRCFATQIKRAQGRRRGEQNYRFFFGLGRMWRHQKVLSHGVFQRILGFDPFTKSSDIIKRICVRKRIYSEKGNVSREQTRAEQNNHIVFTQVTRDFRILWVRKNWHWRNEHRRWVDIFENYLKVCVMLRTSRTFQDAYNWLKCSRITSIDFLQQLELTYPIRPRLISNHAVYCELFRYIFAHFFYVNIRLSR